MKEKILSILIIKPSSLGDIVHALPVSPELRKLYPESKICWLVFDHFSEILSGNKYINEIIIWKRHGDFSYNIALIKEIRNHRFDLVIDLQGLLRTALISLLSGARKRIGVPGLREFSYLFEKEVATFKPTQHAVERNLEVIKYLGEPPGMPEFYINISDEEKKFADNLLEEKGVNTSTRLAGFLCGAGIKQKMWPPENFALLADKMIETLNCRIIFPGSEKDTGCVKEVISKMKTKNSDCAIDVTGKTDLKQLCALLKKCSVVIGNDTGPLHLAASLGVIPVGLYGPSSPEILSPYHYKAVCFWKKIECSPCGIKPTCAENKCMTEISVEEVFQSVKELIG